jgi:predicted esterase
LRLVYETVSKRPGFDPDKVVLAGFSQGARVAISIALRQDPIRACGFIAVGPAILDHPIEQDLRAAPALRGHITVGDQDWVLESVKEFHATAAGQGQQWSLHLVPNVAHDFPPDFDDRLGKALTLVADAP